FALSYTHPATSEIYTLSLHDALPIFGKRFKGQDPRGRNDGWITVIGVVGNMRRNGLQRDPVPHIFEWYKQSGSTPRDLVVRTTRSEEHTSELQSRFDLVCRLLLEKKK